MLARYKNVFPSNIEHRPAEGQIDGVKQKVDDVEVAAGVLLSSW